VTDASAFPPSLSTYHDGQISSIAGRLVHRAKAEPFNLVATLIFLLAIVHAFLSSKFLEVAHRWSEEHKARQASGNAPRNSISHRAELFHFLGEVEAIFGIWAVALGIAVVTLFDWPTFVSYLGNNVNFTEPMFVVVIMTLAGTRPILWLSEAVTGWIAKLLGGTLTHFAAPPVLMVARL
jgi:hypothetical protein